MSGSDASKRQRAFRERMRAKGLVSRLVYVRPEHAALLAQVEKALRQPGARILIKTSNNGDADTMGTTHWTTESLLAALEDSELVDSGRATIELLEGVEPAINITMSDYGDLPIQITVSGDQLFCSTTLWDESQVKDTAAFNELLLLVNPVNPLSNFGLLPLGDGRRVYIIFGELSANSTVAHVVEEVETLAENALEAAESFADQLVK